MTKKELANMIALHTALFNRAENMLKRYYDTLPTVGQDYWFEELKKERQILDWLTQQKTDEEEHT